MINQDLRDVLHKITPKQYGYPPALVKACEDQFDYRLRLRTGELIRFSEAEPVSPEWVHLNTANLYKVPPSMDEGRLDCPRGLDVRLDAIVWVQDAPFGS